MVKLQGEVIKELTREVVDKSIEGLKEVNQQSSKDSQREDLGQTDSTH